MSPKCIVSNRMTELYTLLSKYHSTNRLLKMKMVEMPHHHSPISCHLSKKQYPPAPLHQKGLPGLAHYFQHCHKHKIYIIPPYPLLEMYTIVYFYQNERIFRPDQCNKNRLHR